MFCVAQEVIVLPFDRYIYSDEHSIGYRKVFVCFFASMGGSKFVRVHRKVSQIFWGKLEKCTTKYYSDVYSKLIMIFVHPGLPHIIIIIP